MIVFPNEQLNHVTGCKPLSNTWGLRLVLERANSLMVLPHNFMNIEEECSLFGSKYKHININTINSHVLLN